jgi:NADPH-dependent 2,4-dienoyl-CoA reductase/sulfur reductase-like enzyme/nitrite reductase/ring-hydroxylating ferredoxin subunit
MASHGNQDSGPDLEQGVSLSDFGSENRLLGRVGKKAVVLARAGDEIFAVGATCTHYSGPLGEGIVVGDTIRCPWHHACFSLRSGEALGAPAFDPLPRWKVEQRDGKVFVTEKLAKGDGAASRDTGRDPRRIVIVGGGAAGFAAAEMLRRRGYGGDLTMLSSDEDAPYDRPNLSKDYLAGTAEEAWMPLRSDDFYADSKIGLHLRTTVSDIDTQARVVTTQDGQSFPFDRLLLATGAEPVRLKIPGAERPHVFTLRSMADSRAIIEQAGKSKSAVILGAGFIGLEAAAALRERGLSVHVVTQDTQPFEKVLGPDLGNFIRTIHEEHGVTFHLNATIASIQERSVLLSNGREVDADLVIIGVGVRPRVTLAEKAGIATDRGILVDEYLETDKTGIFAAGDAARWHDLTSGERRRVEHWVIAERQGQAAAENMLGLRRPFLDVPFFWSAHYDMTIRYVGHATSWDRIEIDGSLAARDCMVGYKKDGHVVAVAAIGRDLQALDCEASMEAEGRRRAVS